MNSDSIFERFAIEELSICASKTPEDSSAVPQKERVRELQLYAVSEEYLTLRRRLGVSIA